MKKLLFLSLCLTLCLLLALSVTAFAVIPKDYWKYSDSYADAKADKNTSEIIRLGNQIISVCKAATLDKDTAAVLHNVYSDLYPIYETKGDYDTVITYLKQLVTYATYLGFDDTVKIAKARIQKIDPMTEVYAVTQSTAAYPTFDAKNEPIGGAYYGRVYSNEHEDMMANETATSFYVEFGKEDIEDFGWYIEPQADGNRLIHIALNMPDENDTLKEIVAGSHDAYIKKTAQYLATLKGPILLRIGGEMNVWTKLADSSLYKQCYIKIAKGIRSEAPNVALVFSPNDISNWSVDIADYYPGDQYVDWVGVSLYTNKYFSHLSSSARKDYEEMYYGNGAYANPVTKLRDIVERYGSKKPIIITEGGSAHSVEGASVDLSSFAASRINIMFRYLTMVYPQVKCIIYFDVDLNRNYGYVYDLGADSAAMTAYQSAATANPSLKKKINAGSCVYTKLSAYKDTLPQVELSAYCMLPGDKAVTVGYYLDGKWLKTATAIPYSYTLKSDDISYGLHSFKAVFADANGYTKIKTYHLAKYANGTIAFTNGALAAPKVDVPDVPSLWAKAEVDAAVVAGLVPDSLKNSYTASITREDFCKLAMQLITVKTGKSMDLLLSSKSLQLDRSAFTDTSDETILTACALGVVNGVGDNKFAPMGSITRQEAAVMLTRTVTLLGVTTPNSTAVNFTDKTSFASWASGSISFISAMHDEINDKAVMGGVGDNLFSPKGSYTRQQAFITMLRLYHAVK